MAGDAPSFARGGFQVHGSSRGNKNLTPINSVGMDGLSGCCCGGTHRCCSSGAHASSGRKAERRTRPPPYRGRPLLLMAALLFIVPHAALCAKSPPPGAAAVCTKKKPCSPPPPPPPSPPLPGGPRPNFVVILTDDQDEVLNSTHAAYMPALNALLGARGTRFANTLTPTSVCCPARVALLTGRLPHCSNVTANWIPAGAWGKFSQLKLDSNWLPGWLQSAGYHTTLVGKFLNSFNVPLAAKARCPLGWTVFDALTGGTYKYFNSTFSRDCGPNDPPTTGQYQTDVIRDKALGYIDQALNASKPFYLHVTPVAPHVDNDVPGGGWQPPPPAPRHAGLYAGGKLPANPTLLTANPLIPDTLIKMGNAANAATMRDLYLARLRALRAVDDMLQAIVSRLEERGVLNNTYVVFASDNGLHMGQHSLDAGKGTNLEEDNRVPLFITGPGVPAGRVSAYQASLVDLAPTIMTLAGLPTPSGLDGLPLPLENLTTAAYDAAMQKAVAAAAARAGAAAGGSAPPPLPAPPAAPDGWRRDGLLLEAWDSDAKSGYFPGITFKALRLCTSAALLNFTRNQQTASAARAPALMVPQPPRNGSSSAPLACVKYSVWCRANGRELYDLSVDPYESTNLITAAPARLLNRLDALLSVLVHCRGGDCAHPYGVLHPSGDVVSFEQAMDPRYDALYSALPRFSFASCYPFYVPPNERTFTLGLPGFPANASWESTGIVWPLPNGKRGFTMSGGGER